METNQHPKNKLARYGDFYPGQQSFGANKSKTARKKLKTIRRAAVRAAKQANGGRLSDQQMVDVQESIRATILDARAQASAAVAQDWDDFTRPATSNEETKIRPEQVKASFQELTQAMALQ